MALGKFESGNLAQSFMRMGDKSELLAKSAREQSAALSESFEAPLEVAFFICSIRIPEQRCSVCLFDYSPLMASL